MLDSQDASPPGSSCLPLQAIARFLNGSFCCPRQGSCFFMRDSLKPAAGSVQYRLFTDITIKAIFRERGSSKLTEQMSKEVRAA